MDITPYDKPLKWLIEGVETADIVLPEFQRSFVWRRDDVKDLLTTQSLAKGPISAKINSVDHKFPAEAAPTPPVRGHGSPLCSKIVIY